MTWTIYFGKIGIDNLLLLLVGVLHLCVYFMKRREGNFRRLRLELFHGFFFLGFGFTHDLYRYTPLRTILLLNFENYLFFRSLVLFIFLFPLYIELIYSILAIFFAKKPKPEKCPPELR